ncbi:MAG: hypothetical protein IPK35_22780 [Saprospiraceae bacterium]|jgi:hypothetical protein|nr:hypothetical protein [Saprospiraceae bacterium]
MTRYTHLFTSNYNFIFMKFLTLHWISILLLTFVSCSNSQKSSDNNQASKPSSIGKNFLTMKINGQVWSADHDVFGAFHPKGYDKVIIIAGATGKKDKTEKTFNINIYQTDGPGQFSFAQGNKALSVAQIGNWSEQDYICGSMMGFDMKVSVTKANNSEVEATFSGTLTCSSGQTMVITDGKFYYHE